MILTQSVSGFDMATMLKAISVARASSPFLFSSSVATSPPLHSLSYLAASSSSSPAHAKAFCTASSVATEWKELQSWRTKPAVDHNRFWGPKGPEKKPSNITVTSYGNYSQNQNVSSLAEWGSLILSTQDPLLKAELTHHAYCLWCDGQIPLGASVPPDKPARPAKPELVPTKEIPSIKKSPLPHNAYILHNLTHVELNAIDLAWDTVVRFSSESKVLGLQFISDFVHVADDESRHFLWCLQRLSELGFRYGDMPAHNLLWRECERTSDSITARLAIIPMVQEARGLDAGPRLVQKLVGLGDNRTSKIVAQIAEEELAHVAVGVSWFLTVCGKLGCSPTKTFKDVIKERNVELKGPFNYAAREKAGIPKEWYDITKLNPPDCLKNEV